MKQLLEEAKALMASGDATTAAAMDFARRFRATAEHLKSSEPSLVTALRPKLKAMMDDARVSLTSNKPYYQSRRVAGLFTHRVIEGLVYSISSNVLENWANLDLIIALFEGARRLKSDPTTTANYSHDARNGPTFFVFHPKLVLEESWVHHSIKLDVNGTSRSSRC